MQECNVVLRLGGSLLHTVPMTGVTPAEIVCLQAIHGDDAVVDIKPTIQNKASHNAEFERLATKYNASSALSGGATALVGDGGLVGRLFPGAVKRLPVNLKDIGLGHLKAVAASLVSAEPADEPAEDEDEVNHGED